MALTESNMLPLGILAPDFSLPSAQGATVRLADFTGKSLLLVAFICNHCPFVKHVRTELAAIGREYQERGVGMVAISSNDVAAYPADNMDRMKEEVVSAGYTFPYLLDTTQEVAKAYDAACTPDFYLFDADFRLIYRGQLDESRPGSQLPLNGADLRAALEAGLSGKPQSVVQKPSMGCNIKWKSGHQPA